MAAAEYRKLIVIAWVIIAAAMGLVWGPKAWSGNSWDTDDFMRLVQVRDLLEGQDWRDLTQHRLNPPGGTLMHWSRLPDVPLAVAALALSPILGERNALLGAAMLVPPLYYLLFLTFFAFAARLMLGRAHSPVAFLLTIGGSIGIIQFLPGRVDHHGLQLVAMMAALTLLLFGLARERWGKAIAWAGVPLALSTWIGAETLPMVAAWFAALGLAWCYAGGQLARQGAIAGLLGAAIGAVILVTSQPRALWFEPVCDGFSLMPIGILAFIGTGFAGMAVLGPHARSPWARLAIAAVCGAAAGGVFAMAFPACLHGVFEAVDPVVKLRWLSFVNEAKPWTSHLAKHPLSPITHIWMPALGLGYCLWRIARAGRRGRLLWGVVALLIFAMGALIFWQVRAVSLAQSMALLPLSGLVADVIRHAWRSRMRWLRYAVATLMLYICSIAFWPSVQATYNVLAAKASETQGAPRCARSSHLVPLQGTPPVLILSYIDLGPTILFHTQHSVLGAPYHRNNDGLRTTIELFSSNDDSWIKAKLTELRVGWILTCPGREDKTVFKSENQDGLAERLAAGQVPDYLEEVPNPEQSGIRIYRVRTGA
jgi:hypothetical protein